MISPLTYNAYRCSGKCDGGADGLPFPLRNYAGMMYATHYRIQKYSEPATFCCVPTAYDSLTVIYQDSHGLKMRVYKDMVVTKCTCAYRNTTEAF